MYRIFTLVLCLIWLTACNAPAVEPTPTPLLLPTVSPETLQSNNNDLVGDEPIEQLFASPAYAMHTSTWWRPEEMRRGFDYVADAGFGWVKQPIAWSDIEKGQDGFDWYFLDEVIVPAAEERGLKLVLRLDRSPLWAVDEKPGLSFNTPPADVADFGDFCFKLAERYKGRIAAYQVWNEPNLHREWGNYKPDPVAYTELLQACYEGVKSADSAAIVISAGLAPTGTNSDQVMPDPEFLQAMYDAGAADYFDVLGLNAPGFNNPPAYDPAQAPADNKNPAFTFRHVETMRRIMLANGDGAKQVAILEMGWISNDAMGYTDGTLEALHNDYNWFAVDNDTQAQYLVDAYRYAEENWQPWIGLMTTLYVADPEWTPEANEQWWWSIVLPDGTLRPAYEALREMEK